jgi:hypothetical protein
VTSVWHGEHVVEDQGQPPLVLVISAWRERDGLRARITFSHPDDQTGRTSVVASGSDRVLEVVAQWLRQIRGDVSDRER